MDQRFDDFPDIGEEVFSRSSFESELNMTIPSPSFLTAGGKILSHERKKSLKTAFPVPPEYANPARFLQGGYLTTLIDDTFGPLSYLAAGRPTVTLSLSTTFIRPVSIDEEYVVIEAFVVSRGRTVVTMNAEVRNPKGKLLATATSVNQVMG